MLKKMRMLIVCGGIVLWYALAAQAADKTPEQLINEARAAIKEVSIQDVKTMLDVKEKVIILDIRSKKDYEEEHIPGAVNVPTTMNIDPVLLYQHVHALTRDETAKIIVYCMYNKKSLVMTRMLNDHGYKNAVSMMGGLEAWEDAKYPVVEKK